MKLTILGCFSATPRNNAQTTAQILEVKGDVFLIDCGEGTQIQLRKMGIKFNRIKNIFISHLHGDHFFGLIGLISTFRLLGRTSDLNIYGPKGIKEIILTQLKHGKSWTDYNLIFHELVLKKSELIFENDKLTISTIPLDHRIYTNGFFFKEKIGLRRINKSAVDLYSIDYSYYENLKNGKDFVTNNEDLILNKELTFNPKKPKSYAFCSDTGYDESIVSIIKNSSVLYHESTFLEKDRELAIKTKHSTAFDAAKIAVLSKANKLVLGHFSSRYNDLSEFIIEAKSIFNNVELAEEGKIIKI
ncbi:MAG: ribonuclease Z [Flavobacteriaceae bacterium]|nr:ribonuclease Z [Flavobacteriaceae bacterium]